MIIHSGVARLAAAAALIAPAIQMSAAHAGLQPQQLPLTDTICSNSGTCTTDGTRTVTITQPLTVTSDPSGSVRVTGQARVDFAGTLHVGGQATTPYAPAAEILFGTPAPVTVALDTSYVANIDDMFDPAYQTTYVNPGSSFTILSQHVSAINLDVRDGFADDAATGQGYVYNLSAIDPSAVIGNAVALAGTYQSEGDEAGPLVFGKLSGTATLVGGTELTQAAGFTYLSPFAVQTRVQTQETTRLDADGLVTPKIAVTDGIDMNGSRVTNLGAGVAATDAVNKGQLDAEATARASADTALGTRVDREAAARSAVDGALGTRIDEEATTRAGADTALGTRLSSETSARMAMDANLSSRLDGISDRVDALDGRIDRLDRRAAGGTAVAVAMGGAAFLPNMHFNLTANVATYDGAHAGAVQLGALVSDHVALNVGVATGFNRGGRTAARTGVTLGW